jgi:hypothetical protein
MRVAWFKLLDLRVVLIMDGMGWNELAYVSVMEGCYEYE